MMEAENVRLVLIIQLQLKISRLVKNHFVINMKRSQKKANANHVLKDGDLIQRLKRNV